jgi:hypothetical protein
MDVSSPSGLSALPFCLEKNISNRPIMPIPLVKIPSNLFEAESSQISDILNNNDLMEAKTSYLDSVEAHVAGMLAGEKRARAKA